MVGADFRARPGDPRPLPGPPGLRGAQTGLENVKHRPEKGEGTGKEGGQDDP